MNPKVSVLISAYNHGQFIEACINSVLRQTYDNIELIVIDDGSRDATTKILEGLQRQHGFTFVAKTNSGLTATLNQALAMATGKYICQFGSDDIMMLDKTEKQVRFMEENPDVDVSGGNALLIDRHGKILDKRQKFPPDRNITFEHLFSKLGPGIIASTCMIRKVTLDKEGGWDPAIPLEDMYMWLKLTSRGYKMFGMNDVLMYYRKHSSNTYKNVRYMFSSIMKTVASYEGHPLYGQVRLNLLRKYFLTAAKHDHSLAYEILPQIPLRAYNKKVLRGFLHLLRPESSGASGPKKRPV